MGIRDFDSEKAFAAMKKMQTTPAVRIGGGFAGNRNLVEYLKYQYVPFEKGRFSNSLEYSYDDWTVVKWQKHLVNLMIMKFLISEDIGGRMQ